MKIDKLCIPYIRGPSENVEKAQQYGGQNSFKNKSHFETPLDEGQNTHVPSDPVFTKGVLCKIPCECGKMYVSETGKTIKACLYLIWIGGFDLHQFHTSIHFIQNCPSESVHTTNITHRDLYTRPSYG